MKDPFLLQRESFAVQGKGLGAGGGTVTIVDRFEKMELLCSIANTGTL